MVVSNHPYLFKLIGGENKVEYKKEKIKGFPDYEIDTNGVVYGKTGKPMKTNCKQGYAQIGLRKDGVTTVARVHRLVLIQFTDESEHLSHIIHINGDKNDNRLENLRWTNSNIEGYLERTKEEREQRQQQKQMEKDKKKKDRIVVAYTEDDKVYKSYVSLTAAAREFTENLHSGKVQISQAVKLGKKAYGYYWRKYNEEIDTTAEGI